MRRVTRACLMTCLMGGALTQVSCEPEDPEPDIDAGCKDLESGHACTWVGMRDAEGFNEDGHHRLESLINQPQDMVFLSDGTAWFTDFNNFLVRRILTDDTL